MNHLYLHGNHSDVEITKELSELWQLQILDLLTINLSGTIPWAFNRLANIQYLVLSDNSLVGPIPDNIYAKSKTLQHLFLG